MPNFEEMLSLITEARWVPQKVYRKKGLWCSFGHKVGQGQTVFVNKDYQPGSEEPFCYCLPHAEKMGVYQGGALDPEEWDPRSKGQINIKQTDVGTQPTQPNTMKADVGIGAAGATPRPDTMKTDIGMAGVRATPQTGRFSIPAGTKAQMVIGPDGQKRFGYTTKENQTFNNAQTLGNAYLFEKDGWKLLVLKKYVQ